MPPADSKINSTQSSTSSGSVSVAFLNAHSVGNKSASINNRIVDKCFDIFWVVETWHDGANSPCLIECTPPDFKSIERASPHTNEASVGIDDNYGGICVFLRTLFHVSIISLPDYKSIEVLALSVRSNLLTTALVTVYRPGSTAVSSLFFEEFADMSWNAVLLTQTALLSVM